MKDITNPVNYSASSLLSDLRSVFLHSISNPVGDNPPVEKKYKPLNTTPNATKEIKVKIIPAQRKAFSFFMALELRSNMG